MMNLPPLPKPWDLQHDDNGFPQVLFTAEQLRTYGRLCAEAEREACAKLCEAMWSVEDTTSAEYAIDRCADAIRARSK